jgi:hypothetical protein
LVASGAGLVTSGKGLVVSEHQPQTTSHQPLAVRRAAILIGPEFGTVSRPDLVAAAREAADAGFDVLIACAFNYDAHSAEFEKLGRIPVLKARMNPDLHMADELKNTGAGNLFVVFGEPDIEVAGGAAPVHRDPPQPVYQLRKIQCISQRTWNGLRVWLRQSLAKPELARPLAPQGGRGAKGRARARKTSPHKSIRVDSGVSPQVIPRRVK